MIVFKRGNSFKYVGNVSAVINGVRTSDFTGWTLEAQLRRKIDGTLISAATVSWVDAASGRFTVEVDDALTANWAEGLAEFDIRFTSPSGDRTSTETVSVKIVSGATR